MAEGRHIVSGMSATAPAKGGNVELDSGLNQLNETSVVPQDKGTVALTVQAQTGQTADLLDVVASDGVTKLFSVSNTGVVTGTVAGMTSADAVVTPSANGTVGLTVNPHGAGQTAPLVEVKDAAGNVCFRIDKDGVTHILTGATVHADL